MEQDFSETLNPSKNELGRIFNAVDATSANSFIERIRIKYIVIDDQMLSFLNPRNRIFQQKSLLTFNSLVNGLTIAAVLYPLR